MSAKVIYFEKPTEATKEFVAKYKESNHEVNYWQELSEEERTQKLAEAGYLIVATFPITKELLAGAPQAKLVQRAGIGLDSIDLNATREKNVIVCNTPGVNAISVAEMTIGMILALFRKVPMMDASTKQGGWLMWDYRPEMYEMAGKVHGILGMGNVGKEVAKRSKAFGTQILYTNAAPLSPEEEAEYGAKFSTTEEILRTADIVSVHVPLLLETRNLISEKELAMMKPTAILVNVARGNIIDEVAVAKALQEKRLLGAAFDTFASEPIGQGNPLQECQNAILTPHIAGGTRDVLEASIAKAFENISLMENGQEPKFIVKC